MLDLDIIMMIRIIYKFNVCVNFFSFIDIYFVNLKNNDIYFCIFD